jgi:ribosome-binding protein aMBF1 (putative translation factor)
MGKCESCGAEVVHTFSLHYEGTSLSVCARCHSEIERNKIDIERNKIEIERSKGEKERRARNFY